MAIKPLSLAKIKERVPNLYEAVVLASRYARKLNDENKLEFNAVLGTMSSGHEDEFEDHENPEQLKLALDFEKREKPQIKAIKQLIDDGIEYRYKTDK